MCSLVDVLLTFGLLEASEAWVNSWRPGCFKWDFFVHVSFIFIHPFCRRFRDMTLSLRLLGCLNDERNNSSNSGASYCWWYRTPARKPVEVGSLSYYFRWFLSPSQVVLGDFWTIDVSPIEMESCKPQAIAKFLLQLKQQELRGVGELEGSGLGRDELPSKI